MYINNLLKTTAALATLIAGSQSWGAGINFYDTEVGVTPDLVQTAAATSYTVKKKGVVEASIVHTGTVTVNSGATVQYVAAAAATPGFSMQDKSKLIFVNLTATAISPATLAVTGKATIEVYARDVAAAINLPSITGGGNIVLTGPFPLSSLK